VISIKSGLKNPSIGPYKYSFFNVQFNTKEEDGQRYGIDGVSSRLDHIQVDCKGNCDVCD
jgi:hypothetical protein